MISTAVQKGEYVYVYDERNRTLAIQHGQLSGYTSSTFSIRRGSYIYTFDEKNRQKSVIYSK